ncbi:MAG: DeoR/GlpR family DNA-binding transcription regulator [Vagococcus sp.]
MKNSVKNIEKRHNDILDVLKDRGQMTTEDLALELNVSLSTIRRDLLALKKKNDIIRNHGYCSYNNKKKTMITETGPLRVKKMIGHKAASFINNYDTLFLNASTTALSTLENLDITDLTVISNSLKIMDFNKGDASTYILTGGEIRQSQDALVGDIATNTLLKTNADICILGCSGIDIENGVTTHNLYEAKVNEVMTKKTLKNKILVADHTKVGKTSKFKFGDITSFDYLITDQYSSNDVLSQIERAGVKVIQIFI